MAEFPIPRTQKKGRYTQLSYELPSRIHCAKTYPRQAPNGSTVIIYGHASGIRVLWRGGRRFKNTVQAPKVAQAPSKSKLPDNDAIMIIDSDDEVEAKAASKQNATQEEEAEFEQDGEEHDPASPWPTIIQDLDIPTGSAVVDISLPNVPTRQRNEGSMPRILNNKIVIAAGCMDGGVRIFSLPLSPPSPAKKSSLRSSDIALYVQEAKLEAGPNGHRTAVQHVSLTWTRLDIDPEDQEERTEDNIPTQPKEQPAASWDLLLASSSSDVSGLLLISRVRISDSKQSIEVGNIQPLQRIYLPSPAVQVCFNSAQYPLKRATQLLVAELRGTLRVYNPLAQQPWLRPRRGSNASMASSVPSFAQGTWLASFTGRYSSNSADPTDVTSSALSPRRGVLSAQWVCQGRGIIALMSDGEWGLWDFDEAAPLVSNSLARPPLVDQFAIRGFVDSSSRPSTPDDSKNLHVQRQGFAPMTPKTRKVQEKRLFNSTSAAMSSANTTPLGGISVIPKGDRNGVDTDEDVLFWFAGKVSALTSVRSQWRSALENSRNQDVTLSFGQNLMHFEAVDSQGEMITHVECLSTRHHNVSDLLVTGEHRLLVLSKDTPSDFSSDLDSNQLIRIDNDEGEDEEMGDILGERTDKNLLSTNDLGLDGVNRMLDSIGGGTFGASTRKVGFAAS